jgi:hypothetical protein
MGKKPNRVDAAIGSRIRAQRKTMDLSLMELAETATAAALLTAAIVKDTIGAIEDDDDVVVAGIFAFVFSNYFALLLASNFEMASALAIMKGLGAKDFDRSFGTIRNSYNGMVQSDPKVIDAIG